jgi:DNA-binding response OmpR family regulator
MSQETILVVDDEPHIIELATLYLKNEGYRVISADDGAQALQQIETERPALVILDLMLPEMNGWEVCRRVRASSNLPIIMLTARSEDVDKIVGLELGADDYVTKPFNPRELVARVKAVLRRADAPPTPGAGAEVLAEHQGIVLSRQQLLDLAWGFDYYGETRTVDVHIAHLRQQLGAGPVAIETVWGIGYKLVVE